MTGACTTVVLVGLGDVAETHLAVLASLEGVSVLAGVDPAGPRQRRVGDRRIPVYRTIAASAAEHDPDLVVIATPTPTHGTVADEVAVHLPAARVLIEKPAADNLPDAQRLLARPSTSVAFHMAFSDEVRWAAAVVTAHADELGAPVAIEAWAADAYQGDLAAARRRLCSSWIDSGVNLLSVLERFVTPMHRVALRSVGPEEASTFEARVKCVAGDADVEATILTSWQVTAAAKRTRIEYESGAVVVMDHTAVAAYVLQDQALAEYHGSSGTVPRRLAHYDALYRSWLPRGDGLISQTAAQRLHEVLL